MKHQKLQMSFTALAAAVMLLGSAPTMRATPYATAVTSSGGIVSFTLNESADLVKILWGSTTFTLGPLAKGSYSTNVGASGVVFVEVTKNGGLGFRAPAGSNFTHTVNSVAVSEIWAGRLLISDDANPLTRFPTPRGVGVNRNPASPHFGRVYVGNSSPGTVSGVRTNVGRGLFVLNSDLSETSYAYGTNGQTGGITNWALGGTSAPYQLTVGSDDYIYVADFSDASSVVARVTPDLTFGERVLEYILGPSTLPSGQNHGSTKKILTTGSLTGGDLKLYTLDEDYIGGCMVTPTASKNSIWRYDINSGPLTNTDCGTLVCQPAPSWTVTGTQDFTIGTNGYIYATQNRSAGGESGLYVFDLATGNNVWNSLAAYRSLTGVSTNNDILNSIHGVEVSPDHKFLAVTTLGNGGAAIGGSDTWIIPLVNGIPDLANRMVLDSGSVNQHRGVAFDAAGNLYTVSSGDTRLRVFSPGGFTVTKSGTDGSFNLTLPATKVTVTAGAATISEGTSTSFTITRAGDTSVPLTVNYLLSGTAANGSDYSTLSGSVVLKPGDSSTNITLAAIADGISEATENVTLSLGGGAYTIDSPSSASVSILDLDPPVIQATPNIASMFERHTNDYAGITISRLGYLGVPINVDLTNLTFSGTAVAGVDYIILSNSFPITIAANVLTTPVNLVSPLDNNVFTGNKTIVVGTAAGSGFNGSLSNTSLTILDDENPAETLLYSNPLTSSADAVNWGVTFANGDLPTFGGTDYEASFGYDLIADPLSVGPIGPAPSGATTALRVTVNKANASNAGVNLYPTNQTFSGDYAVRFSMNIITDTASGTTHGPIFGINHDGTQTNWYAGSGIVAGGPWASDGIWYWISADGGAAAGDYFLHTGVGGVLPNTGWQRPVIGFLESFQKVFKGPPAPYSGYAGPGLVANDPPALGGNTTNWTDVEIKQIGRRVNLYLNKSLVLTYSNSTTFTSGTIMLGYDDPFNSVGNAPGAVYYSNLRVVRLGPPQITNISRSGSNVSINFSSNDGTATTASFKLQASTLVTGAYADVPGATVTQLADGSYQATATSAANTQFYRISKP